MKLRNLFTLLLLNLSHLVSGQSTYFTFKTLKAGKELSFPIFSDLNGGNVAEKINQLLQISELEILANYQKKDIFENVVGDDGTIYGGKVEISFDVIRNNSKSLSIGFNEASCGATCTYWVRYYNFNSGNGEMFQLRDLFTKSGFETFSKVIAMKRVSDFNKELSKLDSTQRSFFTDIINCYKSQDLRDFYIKGGNLFIDGENCFSKNQKFAGIQTVSKFNLVEFKKYLNDYGRAVFSLSQDSVSKFHSTSLPQLFQGQIAGNNILMVMNNVYKQEMRAEYVYLKYGKGIFLEGELVNGKLTLVERDEHYADAGFVEAIFDGKQIIGTWTSKDRLRKYKIALRRK